MPFSKHGEMSVAAAVVCNERVPRSRNANMAATATVRQHLIALMTFIWSRLTCPALARRRTKPWSRKISATSSLDGAGRGRLAGGCHLLLFLGFLRGCDNRSSGLSMAAIIPGYERVRAVVSSLSCPSSAWMMRYRCRAQQMGREAVAQRVQRHALLDPAASAASWNRRLAGGWSSRAGLAARKQPTFLHGRSRIVSRWARLPPLAQQIERLRATA